MAKKKVGKKFDLGKLRWSLLPAGVMTMILMVLEYGANKYGDNNWQLVENARERYYNAAKRHIDAWWSGELCDGESGLHHLAHACCCLMFLMWFDITGGFND